MEEEEIETGDSVGASGNTMFDRLEMVSRGASWETGKAFGNQLLGFGDSTTGWDAHWWKYRDETPPGSNSTELKRAERIGLDSQKAGTWYERNRSFG